MNRKIAAFVALAAVLAVLFVRLGFWQVKRLGERRARNAQIAARLAEPVQPVERLRDSLSYRRVTVAGRPDYDHEIILTGRSRNGSPGVYILTPVRRAATNTDTAVIVIRGWVYAPDAASADLSRWRETRNEFSGYTAMMPSSSSAQPISGPKLRALSWQGVRTLLPYPVAPRYVVSQDSAADTTPARLPAPELDDGPHLSYAIQWFSFALIAIGGSAAVIIRSRRPEYAGSTGA